MVYYVFKDQTKFGKIKTKTRILNFQVKYEKCIKDYWRSLTFSCIFNVNQFKEIKAGRSALGRWYSLSKVYNTIVNVLPPLKSMLSVTGKPMYRIEKFLVPILNYLTSDEFTVTESFLFTQKNCCTGR